MSGRVVWVNGKLVPEEEARVSIYDSAMMFGDTVFEMTRSFNKKQFKLREHLDRLYSGIKILRIPLSMTSEEMEKHVYEVIEANDPVFEMDDEHRVMINVTRGLLSIYRGVVGSYEGPNVYIADFPLRWTVSSMGPLFDMGINAVIPSQRAIPSDLLDPKIKNRSRLHYLMANIEVSGYAGDNNWALLIDPDGYVAEGTGDNFFIVKSKKVVTPEGRNILRGISRDYIFDICNKLNLRCIEKNIGTYDVYTADEAFMTGTPFCMMPVTSLNGCPIGDGKRGSIFNRIISKWSIEVGVDIEAQIKGWYVNPVESGNSSPTPYKFK